jgi:hypothetical protein
MMLESVGTRAAGVTSAVREDIRATGTAPNLSSGWNGQTLGNLMSATKFYIEQGAQLLKGAYHL